MKKLTKKEIQKLDKEHNKSLSKLIFHHQEDVDWGKIFEGEIGQIMWDLIRHYELIHNHDTGWSTSHDKYGRPEYHFKRNGDDFEIIQVDIIQDADSDSCYDYTTDKSLPFSLRTYIKERE